MNSRKLTELELELLQSVVTHRLGWHNFDARRVMEMSADKRFVIMNDALCDELMATGFREDWEPNKRGLMIEGIIAKLNPINDEDWEDPDSPS